MNEHEQAEVAISEGVKRELERLTDQSERAAHVLEQRQLVRGSRRLPPHMQDGEADG